MSRHILLVLALILVASAALVSPPVAAEQPHTTALLHLRRATFDPLDKNAPAVRASAASNLLLVQLSAAPNENTAAELEAAGLRPLWYVPDNAFLVRAIADVHTKSLPAVRWIGAFDLANKRSPDLDALLDAPSPALHALLIVVAPDTDPAVVAAEIAARGGALLASAPGLNGAVLRVTLPGIALGPLLARDDVLWIEPFIPATTLDDRARALVGVPTAVEALGLTGVGQTVAVTDTGLDIQNDLSADFQDRVARGYSRAEMFAPCAGLSAAQEPLTWSDLHGHGTHVAGMIAGTGALSDGQFAGVAPDARLVMQSVSSGGDQLDCMPDAETYLQLGYNAGARVHNGSFGRRTGSGSCEYGCYTGEDASVDDFLWRHKDYLFVVAAGNSGRDVRAPFGVIDQDSISSPATAKNVLAVGASENDRPGVSGCSAATPERTCWSYFDATNASGLSNSPFGTDQISNNSAGMAAFSGRGPTDDGRIKPEIVAPGTNVISARTHYNGVRYGTMYNFDYVYLSGTSMATPQISGLAALTRQWLAERRQLSAPSAALVKALLLNGAASLRPGQYPSGDELPNSWPNTVEGWGRASITETSGVGRTEGVWLKEHAGLRTGVAAEYMLNVRAGAPLRVTLAWTDYPAAAGVGKALVNDLDLEVVAPGGVLLYGNTAASLPAACRSGGADRCNTVESVELVAPASGNYVVRVRGATVPRGPQPFAVAAHAGQIIDRSLASPVLSTITSAGPRVALSWSSVAGATSYRVELSPSSGFDGAVETIVTTAPSLDAIQPLGTHYARVKACTSSGCGEYSNTESAVVAVAPKQTYLPAIRR